MWQTLVNPLIILFQNSIKSSHYPKIWKKSNIIPVHKQNDYQLIQNYRPISLLPISLLLFLCCQIFLAKYLKKLSSMEFVTLF